MFPLNSKCLLILVLVNSIFLAPSPIEAYNFLFIHPGTGEPVTWDSSKPIEYWVDSDECGRLTNEQANLLVGKSMQVWEEAGDITFIKAGVLELDVNTDNFTSFVDDDMVCYEEETCPAPELVEDKRNVIVFDRGREILSIIRPIAAGIGGAKLVSGSSQNPGFLKTGFVVIDCSLVDGSEEDLSINEFTSILIHEIGHFLGLAHSSLNRGGDVTSSIFTPIMNPNFLTVLRPDDSAGIDILYPSAGGPAGPGAIRGTVRDALGKEFRSASVIARNVSDPFCEAFEFLSGRNCVRDADSFGCDIDSQRGDYEIKNLPPGTYALIVQDISSYGSINIDAEPLPGDAEFWNEGDAANEDPYLYTLVEVGLGEVIEGINFVTSSDVATDDQTDFIPPEVIINLFGEGPGTRCPLDQIDYAAIIGVDDPLKDPNLGSTDGGSDDSGSTPSSGGCSLVR